ncbi:MAG: nuclear transport factor 2 family protein [Alphaproteobacteria bacterium]|nr:nuclear transport factor 2 family protein [Alphaproteobacteria bacterium]
MSAKTPALTPAGKLVTAFGDVHAMAALYAPSIEWSLSASLPFARPMRGREAVIAFNTAVWTEHYRPDCSVEILDEAGDDRVSAVRFIYRAFSKAAGKPYENEYTLFARSGPAGITEVFEALDTGLLLDFLTGKAIGTAFAEATRPKGA